MLLARLAVLAAIWPLCAQAQASKDAIQALPAITIQGAQLERPAFSTPASIDLVDGTLMRRDQMQVNLSESLVRVPGLLIQNRQNYAQDLQLSIRGFGARSTYGVRGVRLYVDGIPATMPDGQGQTSNIDIASIDSMEILRGPFSALYGNASGGVVQVFTEHGKDPPTLESSFAAGSDSQFRYGAKASGARAGTGLDYLVSANRYVTQGYRDHSSARKNLANAKLGWTPDEDSSLTLVLNSVDVKADDPQGLTYDEFMNDPRQASPGALAYNTRKTVRQTQGGLHYEREVDAHNTLRLMAYYGQRRTVQFLGVPVSAQLAPGSAGGVVDLQRRYGGLDARWTSRLRLAGRPLTIVGGVAYDTMTEDRRGYENFVAGTAGLATGVQGNLRRKETNDIWNVDPYAQASWQFTDRWSVDAGLRYSTVHFDSDDDYIAAGNPDDSGTVRYRKLLPSAALRYQASTDLMLYATAGRGFETPTFSELSYRPDGRPGLNLALMPSENTSLEVGAKARVAGGMLTAALFQTRTRNEIVTARSDGGRTTFQNAGHTRRNGFELAWSGEVADNLSTYLAYTWLDARYKDSFRTVDTRGSAVLVPDGNRIPGIAEHAVYAALDWAQEKGWRAGVEGRYLSRLYVNDSNDEYAPAYFTASVHAGYRWKLQDWTLDAFARLDNVFDRHYAGATVVNASWGRYYEPAPGRNWTAGISLAHAF
ncbi:TonB-dependent receptor [Allopusillimonas soli]|uniref:TonB-dependent receptor n=1 Tax=Allopusillimonas soli TaxID=659016 RepID=A0A853FDD0_9BURK|nr:TonB-dependent receptor [Allopusillimonas soli]TEA74080.1 TonB-dependent receptor [Allopusillimonas soli]